MAPRQRWLDRRLALLGGLIAGCLGLAGAARAQQLAYTGPAVNLRAGPGREYPLISLVPPQQQTELFGCVGDWEWCDVVVGGMRGWVAGSKLRVSFGDQFAELPYYASRIGVPLIAFDFDSYWDRYYRGRPWFDERDRWRRYAPYPLNEGPGPGRYHDQHGPDREHGSDHLYGYGEGRGHDDHGLDNHGPDDHRPPPAGRPGPGSGYPPGTARPGQPDPGPATSPGPPHHQDPNGHDSHHDHGPYDQTQPGGPPQLQPR